MLFSQTGQIDYNYIYQQIFRLQISKNLIQTLACRSIIRPSLITVELGGMGKIDKYMKLPIESKYTFCEFWYFPGEYRNLHDYAKDLDSDFRKAYFNKENKDFQKLIKIVDEKLDYLKNKIKKVLHPKDSGIHR